LHCLRPTLSDSHGKPDVDMRLKTRIVRTLIKEIVVDVDSAASEVMVAIHCKGRVRIEVRARQSLNL
jgi:hypothetical protein